MSLPVENLYENIPADVPKELFQILAEKNGVRIERIVSDGHATPPDQWYDQGWDEWVLVVSGGATLLFDDSAAPLVLKPGDYVMIPANHRHRVERTDPQQKTIWLAVHFGGN